MAGAKRSGHWSQTSLGFNLTCALRQIIQIPGLSVVKIGLTASTWLGCFEDNNISFFFDSSISKEHRLVNSVNCSDLLPCHSTLALIDQEIG